MDFQEIPHRFLKGITFGIYSSEELRKFSVIEITSIKTFDALGHPAANGLHDPALGPSEFNELCKTCGLSQFHCPGHFGHINLPLPVFNPFLLTILHKLLRGSCFNCHSLLASPIAVQLTLAQLRVLDYGLVGVAQEMQQMVAEFQEKESMSNILYIKDKLANHVNKALEGLDLEEAKKCSSVKNVVECRQRIVKNFIRDHLQKSGNKCYYCRTVQRPLSLYFFSCLVFKEKKAKSSKPLPSQSVEEECDDQERNENENISKLISSTNQSLLTAVEARDHLRKLWDKERTILQKLFGISNLAIDSHECPLDMFFLENVMVPPTRFRPISFMKGKKFENPQTAALKNVIHSSIVVRELLKSKKEGINLASAKDDALKSVLATVPGSNVTEKLHSARITLQLKVNAVTDTEMDKLSKEKYPGMKQILEKKEGLFRKHMMGKRVDYAARSVISPDPYIMSDEVGIPMVFATKLTYPQPVTPWNIRELRQAVINGPNVYPGAVLVKKEDGSVVKLSPTNHIQREAIAKKLLTPSHFNKKSQGNKIVYRHLQSGDILLLNRQPTLHKPSIMGHRVRVLPGEKTLRLHYANCKCYNADFDGDEMNVHFPQSELARSEAYNIASVNYQYLVPKDGTPLSGLIQDHVVSGSLLSMRGTFFTREDYQELVFGALTFIQRPLKLLPPCIIKPKALWSGKQIISTVIINIIPLGKPPPTIEGSAKIAAKNWQNKTNQRYSIPLIESMSESTVIIRSGELLCGVLDKAHYGPTPYGLVHCCYELYGGQTSTLLLTSLARLFTHYLQIHIGFTLGIEDITVTSKANKKRWKIMKSAKKVGDKTIAEALDVTDYTNKSEIISKYQDAHLSKNDLGRKQIDAAMKTETDTFNNEINKICIPDGLWKKFPQNNLQLMIQSGAKGSSVNAMQISCLLGQIELEGKRVPLMISGKSLPSFLPYDTTPRAGGFVDGRFLTGIRPQEYFFHCMAGREGLVDTAVKTSRSGYLQRCLIKHLEGITVNYDLTVRDSDGSVIQYQYGEDGLDILKMQMLKEKQFPTLIKNYHAAVNESEIKEVTEKLDCKRSKKLRKDLKSWTKRHGNYIHHLRVSGFTEFSSEFLQQLRIEHPGRNNLTGCEHAKEKLCKLWHDMESGDKERYNKPWVKRPDPISSQAQIDTNFGLISEKLDSTIENYISCNRTLFKNSNRSSDWISKKHFRNLIYFKYLKSLASPGEAVGLLAAQSIGEPSTQMTLNTFHFAGRGEMNVTLGIPRLREILMVASTSIATPSMDLPLLPIPDAEKKAEELRKAFTAVRLAQVLEKLKVVESLRIKDKSERSRSYCIHFTFLPYKAYKRDFCVNPSSILKFMESSFTKQIVHAIKKNLKILAETKPVSTERGTRNFKAGWGNDSDEPIQDDKEGESSEEEEGDGDTTSAKHRSRHDQEQEYEEPEEEERMANPADEMSEVEDNDQEIKQEQEEENEEMTPIEKISHSKQKIPDVIKNERIRKVLMMHSWLVDYDFDTESELWCKITVQLALNQNKLDMTTLMEEESAKAIVYQTPGINRAFVVKDTDTKGGSGKMIKTEGVNIQEMFKYENILDVNRIYSNDIHAICRTYGIEAAARAIVKEVKNVFAVYGIEVDPRHLLLIADYMTFDGAYKPCNRVGMENSSSPLQQMSFETTMKFLNSAVLAGAKEQLKSPSSRLVVGHVVSGGTGCFDLLQPISKCKQ